jgi:hypothetical protein
MREEEVSEHLGELLKQIYVPETIACTIVDSLSSDLNRANAERQEQLAGLKQRLAALRTRMDALYEDKQDGKIKEEFWTRKQAEYSDQERSLETALSGLNTPITPERMLTVQRIFELANQAHSLYLTRNLAERGQLLKSVLLNCATDGVNLWPTYRKPFDLIFQRAKNEEWSGREDLNLRPPGPETKNFSQVVDFSIHVSGASTVQTHVIPAHSSQSFSYGCPRVGAPRRGVRSNLGTQSNFGRDKFPGLQMIHS